MTGPDPTRIDFTPEHCETEATPSLPPLKLTGRQQLVLQVLSEIDRELAKLYQSALRVLADSSNPGRLLLAAHAIREMTAGLPKFLNLPILADQGRLGDQVSALERVWASATNSQCHKDGNWAGEIDCPLRKLLQKLGEFFQWYKNNRPRRRRVAAELFRATDPAGMPLPEILERRRTERWLELHEYFVRVAHRSSTTEHKFQSALGELEVILLDFLYRRPSEDFSNIDALLAEEETNA